MHKVYDGNFWEAAVPGAAPGMRYKYRICGADGRRLDHCDPYGFFAELAPGHGLGAVPPARARPGTAPPARPGIGAHSPAQHL